MRGRLSVSVLLDFLEEFALKFISGTLDTEAGEQKSRQSLELVSLTLLVEW